MSGQALLLILTAIVIAFLAMPSRRPGKFGLAFGEAGLMSLSFMTALALAFSGNAVVNG